MLRADLHPTGEMRMPKATNEDDAMNQEVLSRLDALSDLVVENMAPLATIRAAVDSIGMMVRDVDARAKRTEVDVQQIRAQLSGEGDGRSGLTARMVLVEEREKQRDAEVAAIRAAVAKLVEEGRAEKWKAWSTVVAAVLATAAAVFAAVKG
jgi:hypothetical protein